MKKVYTCFTTSVIHDGHLNIIREARKYGSVIVGALSDEALIRYNKFPIIPVEERLRLYRNIEGVDQVVIQNEMNYDDMIPLIRPDYVIHGDNWTSGPVTVLRQHLLELLEKYGGQLIEVPYTYSEKVRKADIILKDRLAMPEYRRKRLRQLIKMCPTVKALEAHNGMTGLIAEKTVVENGGNLDQYDAIWVSSLCDSTAKGKPDIELVDMSSRLRTIDEIMDVTTKPIILDGGTGGLVDHFVYNVRTLERTGVSAVVIEDKIERRKSGPEGAVFIRTQEDKDTFCEKIAAGKSALRTEEFMIFARIESLMTGAGMDDAIERAVAYTQAGADGIMIQSGETDPAQLLSFCDKFRELDLHTPIAVIPDSVNAVTEEELQEHGVNIVIYADQMTRSAYKAMLGTAETMLRCHRAKEASDPLPPMEKLISLIDEI